MPSRRMTIAVSTCMSSRIDAISFPGAAIILPDRYDLDADIQARPNSVGRNHWTAEVQAQCQTGAISQREPGAAGPRSQMRCQARLRFVKISHAQIQCGDCFVRFRLAEVPGTKPFQNLGDLPR